jgi:hypothetical protein
MFVMSAACAAESPQTTQDQLCADKAMVAGGSVQLGIAAPFTSITDGETLELVQGLQGLWMFVTNVRAQDMHLGSDASQGIVVLDAKDPMGNEVSLETGCHIREFADGGDGYAYLTTAFLLPMSPNYTNDLEGMPLTFTLSVHDQEGHYASDTHTVIAHFPGR